MSTSQVPRARSGRGQGRAQRLINRPGQTPRGGPSRGRQGTPVGPSLSEQAAIALFIQNNPECAEANQSLSDDVATFLHLLQQAQYNNVDLYAIVRTAFLDNSLPNLPSSRKSRSAGMSFVPATLGVRGDSANVQKPSSVWQTAASECTALARLNRWIDTVLRGQLLNYVGIDQVPIQVSPQVQAAAQAAAQQLAQRYPDCANNLDELVTFLELVQISQVTGNDLSAVIRVLGLDNNLPTVFSGAGTRWARGSTAANTPPVRGRRLSANKQLPSLLDTIARRYCGNIGTISRFLSHVLAQDIVIGAAEAAAPGTQAAK